jgi:hypothetical protein
MARPAWMLPWPGAIAFCALGAALMGVGVGLLAWTVALFARLGHGSLAQYRTYAGLTATRRTEDEGRWRPKQPSRYTKTGG